MAGPENLFERIDGYREEVIDIQRGLTSKVALGPENGGSGEHEKTSFIKELLLSLKPDFIEEIKAPDKRAKEGYRPNLIARWDGSSLDSVVWVLIHSDIVPPGDLTLWETNPYEIVVQGDKIIGRGVEDNQHGFVSSYLGLKALMEAGKKPKKSVGLAIVADEETGSRYGLGYLLKHQKELFKKEDFILVPDFGNGDGTLIEVAEKSMLWLRFIVTGQQCHASTPHKGKNSLFGAAKLIVALEELKTKFMITDELFSPPVSTFEATKMEANVPNVNTIPGRDIFYLDCRILPNYRVDEIVTASRKIAGEISNELELQIAVEPTYRQDATKPTDPDAPVVKALSQAIKEVTGKDAKPMGIGGGTVAAFFRETGLPAAVWCTMPETAHQPNEYCFISNIITDAKIFATLYQQ